MLKRGEIRKPGRNAEIYNVLIPRVDEYNSQEIDGELKEVQVFIPLKEAKYHYFVIDEKYKNVLVPALFHYSVRLITHSENFNNYLIMPEWINDNRLGFIKSDSLITSNKFLVQLDHIDQRKVYGEINLDLVNAYELGS
jgi:hypothetical protein